eukprot:g8036.t1
MGIFAHRSHAVMYKNQGSVDHTHAGGTAAIKDENQEAEQRRSRIARPPAGRWSSNPGVQIQEVLAHAGGEEQSDLVAHLRRELSGRWLYRSGHGFHDYPYRLEPKFEKGGDTTQQGGTSTVTVAWELLRDTVNAEGDDNRSVSLSHELVLRTRHALPEAESFEFVNGQKIYQPPSGADFVCARGGAVEVVLQLMFSGYNLAGRGSRMPQGRGEVISRALTESLRHMATRQGLTISKDGYVKCSALQKCYEDFLALPQNPKPAAESREEAVVDNILTFEELYWVCVFNDKKRFHLVFREEEVEVAEVETKGEAGGAAPEVKKPKHDDVDNTTSKPRGSAWFVRAAQGHSFGSRSDGTNIIDEALLMQPVFSAADVVANVGGSRTMKPLIYHGTYQAVLPDILRSGGLSRMTRQHIHFTAVAPAVLRDSTAQQTSGSASEAPSAISGMRADCDCVIAVDLAAALAAGYRFFRSENGVLLSPGDATGVLSAAFFEKIVKLAGSSTSTSTSSAVAAAPEEIPFEKPSFDPAKVSFDTRRHDRKEENAAAEDAEVPKTAEQLEEERLQALRQEEIWRAHLPRIVWVASVEAVRSLATKLLQFKPQTSIGMDVEGVSLGKDGQVCLIQIMVEEEIRTRTDEGDYNLDAEHRQAHPEVYEMITEYTRLPEDAAGTSGPTSSSSKWRVTSKTVYLIDVVALGRSAFDDSVCYPNLRTVLESDRLEKILFDCRQDVEALFFHFDVLVKNVYDLQISFLLSDAVAGGGHYSRGDRHLLKGLPKALRAFFEGRAAAVAAAGNTNPSCSSCDDHDGLHDERQEDHRFSPKARVAGDKNSSEQSQTLGDVFTDLKEKGKVLYDPKKGGKYEVWAERPMQGILLAYAAVDVSYLLDMQRHFEQCYVGKIKERNNLLIFPGVSAVAVELL